MRQYHPDQAHGRNCDDHSQRTEETAKKQQSDHDENRMQADRLADQMGIDQSVVHFQHYDVEQEDFNLKKVFSLMILHLSLHMIQN